MSSRNRIAFICIAIPALVEIGLGIIYFFASEAMPYHKQVTGMEWSALAPGVQLMLVSLVNAYGSAHFAVGAALIALLAVPLRRREAWARWATLAVGLPVLAATAWTSRQLAAATTADVPWLGALVLLVVFMAGITMYQPQTGP